MDPMNNQDITSLTDVAKLDIPSLPIVAFKVLEILRKESSNTDDLSSIISFDLSFASRLLKAANSPYFSRGGEVSSIDEAILRLGFATVSDIVIMSALKDLRRNADEIDTGLWEHSTAVAVACKLMAEQLGYGSATDHLVHGLLHDIGKMVMNINFKKKYAKVIDEVRSSGKPFEDVEFAVFGYTHSAMGDYTARTWKLPGEIRSAISLHHSIASEIADRKDITDVLLVKAADYICSELRIGIYDNFDSIEKDLEFIGLTNASKIDSLKTKVEEEYPKYKSFLLGE
ncbi:MAG: HDOD domain-containing protein [Dissulfurispiraceae bacterium]|jgi:putative nucleotidyltransferase with HDIG domain